MPWPVLRSDVPELEDLVPALIPVLLTHRQHLAQHGPASGERADSGSHRAAGQCGLGADGDKAPGGSSWERLCGMQ